MARFKVGDRVMVNYDRGRALVAMWHSRGYGVEPGCIVATDVSHEYPHRVKLDIPRDGDDGYWWCAESELTLIPSIPAGFTPASEPPDDTRTVRVITKDGEGFGWHGDTCRCKFGRNWAVYTEDVTPDWVRANPNDGDGSAPGEVICWRDIEPRLTVGQRVRVRVKAGVSEPPWYKAGETGTIVHDDKSGRPLCVKFDTQPQSWYCLERDLEPLPDPEPEPKPAQYVVVNIRQRFDTLEAAEADALREVDKNGVQFVVARVVELVNPGKPEVIRIEE